jgi:hypothetical protein
MADRELVQLSMAQIARNTIMSVINMNAESHALQHLICTDQYSYEPTCASLASLENNPSLNAKWLGSCALELVVRSAVLLKRILAS